MDTILQSILNTVMHEQSHWELLAVGLSISYLLLVMRENLWAWPCAFFGTLIYVFLFHSVFLFMDAALHVYYMAMAVYGFYVWFKPKGDTATVPIQYWSMKKHAFVLASIAFATGLSGYLLSKNTEAAWPYVDSFTTWASVITTYMVARKVIENWLYWIVIDFVAMLLYVERGLYFTAMLFAAYVVIVVFGYFSWRKKYRMQLRETSAI